MTVNWFELKVRGPKDGRPCLSDGGGLPVPNRACGLAVVYKYRQNVRKLLPMLFLVIFSVAVHLSVIYVMRFAAAPLAA